MQELLNKFRELIDFRDKAIEDKFGENRHSAFNFPENRFWYADHISPIDREIVDVANKLFHFYISFLTLFFPAALEQERRRC